MKDKQGIARGECNSCECKEFIAPTLDESEKPPRVRCDYCNHTPVEHVKITTLGKCRSCARGNCEEYESEDPNSYTDCSYCGCPARLHAGAEKLVKKKASPVVAGPIGTDHVSEVVLRHDETGRPVQTTDFGLCKYPGCQYPRRKEKGRVFDYCSKTCADKTKQAQLESDGASNSSNMRPQFSNFGVNCSSSSICQKSASIPGPNSIRSKSSDPTIKGDTSSMFSLMSTPGPSSTMCSKCQKNPPNRGHKWCESCYLKQSSSRPLLKK